VIFNAGAEAASCQIPESLKAGSWTLVIDTDDALISDDGEGEPLLADQATVVCARSLRVYMCD
jgi:hypothetical protein